MRKITHIVLHCTATPQAATVKSIQRYWKEELKWDSPGYHFILLPDGTVVNLWPIDKPSNGVKGHNARSIHISYIGGVDSKNNAIDNRTDSQIAAQIALIKKYKAMFPNAEVVGHRDFPGVTKECPSFDARAWWKSVGLDSGSSIPRRNRQDLYEPAEMAIHEAMQEVEKMPAHVMLTEAVILLQQAKDKVSDYIDGKAAAGV